MVDKLGQNVKAWRKDGGGGTMRHQGFEVSDDAIMTVAEQLERRFDMPECAMASQEMRVKYDAVVGPSAEPY